MGSHSPPPTAPNGAPLGPRIPAALGRGAQGLAREQVDDLGRLEAGRTLVSIFDRVGGAHVDGYLGLRGGVAVPSARRTWTPACQHRVLGRLRPAVAGGWETVVALKPSAGAMNLQPGAALEPMRAP